MALISSIDDAATALQESNLNIEYFNSPNAISLECPASMLCALKLSRHPMVASEGLKECVNRRFRGSATGERAIRQDISRAMPILPHYFPQLCQFYTNVKANKLNMISFTSESLLVLSMRFNELREVLDELILLCV